MDPEKKKQLAKLFAEAAALPETERLTFAEDRCGADVELRGELSLLLQQVAAEAAQVTTATSPPGEQINEWIGPYKLLDQIGTGGFGTVWLAERREPIVQRAALKVLNPGMDTREVLARFEQERQALAVMNHPNVAKVFDAGVTAAGRPYFAMEHVPGESITTYCDRHRLSLRQRLELFIPVCEAVQHAHHKGIIHRDIKPSNILVGVHEGRPVPKVIDFGVAKAVSHTLTQKTIFTEQGRLIGTPEYMSPEQAEMGATDIDTRTDVYALGVVLYELLSGLLPFDSKALRAAGIQAICQMIREQEPPRPSTRLSAASSAASTALATSRRTERVALARELRLELDWIPLKAIRKDRAERYGTPIELAEDIARYLKGEALKAGPESAVYRLRKTLRRNRGSVAAVAAVFVALLLGLAGTLWKADEAQREAENARTAERLQTAARKTADQKTAEADREAKLARAAEQEQTKQRLKADLVSMFMRRTFRGITPEMAQSRDTTVLKELMDVAAQRLERGEMSGNQEASIDLRLTIGRVYTHLALFNEADRMILPAYEQLRNDPAADQLAYIWALICLADLANQRGDKPRARELYRLALPIAQAPSAPEDAIMEILSGLGNISQSEGLLADAISFQRQAVAEARKQDGEERSVAAALGNLASALKMNGEFAEAEPLYVEIVAILDRVTAGDDPAVAAVLNNHGALLLSMGKTADAIPQLARALEMYRRLLGDKHPQVANSLINLCAAYTEVGRASDAEPLAREALEISRQSHPGDSDEVASALQALSAVLIAQNQQGAARPLAEEALAMHRRILGADHPAIATDLRSVALCLVGLGSLDEAEAAAREAIAIDERRFRPDHPQLVSALILLANILRDLEKFDEGARFYRRAAQICRKSLPANHPNIADSLASLGTILLRVGNLEAAREAAATMQECYEQRRGRLPEIDWRVANSKSVWAGALVQILEFDTEQSRDERLRRAKDAEIAARDSFDALHAAADTIPAAFRSKRLAEAADRLVHLYAVWEALEPNTGKAAQSGEWRVRAEQLRRTNASYHRSRIHSPSVDTQARRIVLESAQSYPARRARTRAAILASHQTGAVERGLTLSVTSRQGVLDEYQYSEVSY